MNKTGYIILTGLTVLVLLNISFSAYTFQLSRHSYAYVYIEKVYDAYKGKSAVEKELKAIESKQKNILDTMKLSMVDLDAKVKAAGPAESKKMQEQLETKQENYNKLVQEFSDYNTRESQKHVEDLLKQINQYVKDYGEKNNYEYIFGAAGNGSLMYAKEMNNVSEQVIKYINSKYEGE